MPSSPKKVKRSWLPEKKPFARHAKDNSKFYNSWTWRKKRKAKLQRNPLCEECEAKDIVREATVVDHITPINEGGCKLCDDNLKSLCESCHNSKSGRESHKNRIKKGDMG